MPRTIFLGNDCFLNLSDDGGVTYKVWACCQSLSYVEQSEFIEKTPTDGVQIEVVPTYQGARIEASGLYIITDSNDTVQKPSQLFNWHRNKQLLSFKITMGLGGDIYSGNCYLERVQATGNLDEPAGISISAIVTETGYTYQQAQLGCPVLALFNSTLTSLTLNFLADTDATSYIIKLYLGQTLLQTETKTPPYATPVSVTFGSLSANTTYRVQVTVNNANDLFTLDCTPDNFATDDINCPTPSFNEQLNSIAVSFNDGAQGVDSWEVEVYDGPTLVDTHTFTPPFNNPLQHTFSGLSSATTYTFYINGTEGAYVKACGPFTAVTGGAPIGYDYTVGLGLSTGQACSNSYNIPTVVYSTTTPWQQDMYLFTDAACTQPLLGWDYVVVSGDGNIWNLNDQTGMVVSLTGVTC